jgi:hypothetical protein
MKREVQGVQISGVNGYTRRIGVAARPYSGALIQAKWGLYADAKSASGEVLDRAIDLACMAHPVKMKRFRCGQKL